MRDGTYTLVVHTENKEAGVPACRRSAWLSRHWPEFRRRVHWPVPKYRRCRGAAQDGMAPSLPCSGLALPDYSAPQRARKRPSSPTITKIGINRIRICRNSFRFVIRQKTCANHAQKTSHVRAYSLQYSIVFCSLEVIHRRSIGRAGRIPGDAEARTGPADSSKLVRASLTLHGELQRQNQDLVAFLNGYVVSARLDLRDFENDFCVVLLY